MYCFIVFVLMVAVPYLLARHRPAHIAESEKHYGKVELGTVTGDISTEHCIPRYPTFTDRMDYVFHFNN